MQYFNDENYQPVRGEPVEPSLDTPLFERYSGRTVTMMISIKKTVASQDEVFWYLKRPKMPPLMHSLEADVVIVGGGMAGITAAQSFAAKKKKVVLLEAYYCGAGASGKSSGFITPNSEISLSNFIARYGDAGGKAIWKAIEIGVAHIKKNIEQYAIDCDYTKEDSLFVANSKSSLQDLITEHKNLERFGYKTNYVDKQKLPSLLKSDSYYGGVTYEHTFGINGYKYCQAMKDILAKQDVQIFEETPVLEIHDHRVHTLHAKVKAEHIIVCTDQFTPSLGKLSKEIYHVQNFLLISQVLQPDTLHQIFPERNYMVWDTELIYNFYRISAGRLLLGGGSLWHLYDRAEKHHDTYMSNKLTKYFKKMFPHIDIQFEQMWPGLIGISKDVAPICGPDKENNSIYYVAACAGLPVAAAMAHYCADHLIDKRDDLKDYFCPYRQFFISGFLQTMLGKKLTFAISNYMALNLR